jgi:hypothetical protein
MKNKHLHHPINKEIKHHNKKRLFINKPKFNLMNQNSNNRIKLSNFLKHHNNKKQINLLKWVIPLNKSQRTNNKIIIRNLLTKITKMFRHIHKNQILCLNYKICSNIKIIFRNK